MTENWGTELSHKLNLPRANMSMNNDIGDS